MTEKGKGKGGKSLKKAAAAAMMGLAVAGAWASPAPALGIAAAVLWAEPAWAMEAGAYLVTVTPSYTDPETGRIEDPGNNEAIGQGMTQKLCGPQGLLEVDASGNMYLTVRYYLSQFVSDVSFEERTGGSYTACSYQKMQTRDPVSGASNLDDKYGYTDYRIPIQSLSSVFRGKAYIEPMGRNVVYFFQASGPTAGSGDFVTSIQTGAPAETEAEPGETELREMELREAAEAAEEEPEADRELPEDIREPEEAWEDTESTSRSGDAAVNGNGRGNVDDPVTGIPAKPAAASTRTETRSQTAQTGGNSEEEDYHLQTRYDLSQVPVKEARKLTEPMLEAASGITLVVGELPEGAADGAGTAESGKRNGSKTVMYGFLGAAALLLIRFGAAFLFPRTRTAGGEPEAEAPEEEGLPGEDETERRRNRQ